MDKMPTFCKSVGRGGLLMHPQVLDFYIKTSNKTQSQLAREAQVSRQAVSNWLRTPAEREINLQSKHLQALAKALDVSINKLLDPPAFLSNSKSMEATNTLLNWDRLYPDLISFFIALSKNESVAVARFVQIYGLYESWKILGNIVWDEFLNYKRHIHPAIRKGLEAIWQLRMMKE